MKKTIYIIHFTIAIHLKKNILIYRVKTEEDAMKKIIFIMILTILIGLFVYSNEEKSPVIENLYNFSNEDTTLLWYKNIEFTLGYNFGLYSRGEQLVNSGSDLPLVIYKVIIGNHCWLHSVQSGIRFPINNWAFGIGLGYSWASWSNIFYNVKKCYIYTEYIINPYIMRGFELNYSQEYFYDEIRDLIGGGIYFKLCNTKKKQEVLRFDPYLMFKVSGCSVIRSIQPYSRLWDKRLKIWYTGLYAGFNFNIGGK